MPLSHHATLARTVVALIVGAATLVSPFLDPLALAKPRARSHVKSKTTSAQSAARQAIVATYASYNQAYKKGDVATAMSFLAPDYEHYTLNNTRIDRATFETQMRNMWHMGLPIRIDSLDTKIQSIQWRGPDAIVVVNTEIVTGMPTKRTKPIVARTTERHYWSPTSSGWKLRQVVELKASASNPFG